MKKKLIYLILGVAALVRLVGIGAHPPSLYWEEAALSYDAYSILKTGNDFHGHPWPLVAFESFGDYKPSGYFYLSVPFVALFGLHPIAVRLPSAILGITTMWLLWLICKQLFDDERIGLGAAAILAVLPWHVQFSRAGFEVNAAVCFLCAGLYFLLRARKKPFWLLPAALALVASFYTYHGLRVVAPLMALWTWVFFKPRWHVSRWFYASCLLALVAVFPILLLVREPVVAQRFAETSVFSTSAAVPLVNAWRLEDGNTWWSRVAHHRYWYWGKEILSGALSHFSPAFLFISGDGNPRHQTGLFGPLFHWQLIPLLVGFFLVRKRRLGWVVGWILLATVPSALTNTTPHTLRFLPAAPAFALIIAVGFIACVDWLSAQRWRLVGFAVAGVIVLGEFLFYEIDYFTGYAVRSSQDWQYGYAQVFDFLKTRVEPNDVVWMSRAYGRPSIYAMFYWALSPQEVQAQEPLVPHDQGEFLAVNNFSFTPNPPNNARFLVSDTVMSTHRLIQTITFINGKNAFYIYEN